MSDQPPGGGKPDPADTPATDNPAATNPPEERTVIAPQSEERTVVAPLGEERTVVAPSGAESPPAKPTMAGATSMPTFSNFAPRTDGQAIQVGDVLNHIFAVKRFLARGGMGEVFEGENVNTEERVAIKVMLPALAADPNVIALFRKEAKTLTKLNHDALVKYRVLAQEPQLGVLYIVTEFIDGKNLADVLGTIQPSEDELKDLLRRLASGLAVAHSYGAVHRDLSPDNVLLEDGKLSKPKVIDFGIAKDLDPGSKTVVGEGFAGKLNYVAPEQLGAFERRVGGWTDVYSLGLVILAVIHGRNVQMGGSLIDAVKKRESVPDLSKAPESLRPILDKMLQPDPKDRYQSMDEVVAALGGGTPAPQIVEVQRGVSKPVLIGAAVGGIALIGLVAAVIGGDGGNRVDMTQRARTAIATTLPQVRCSWLDIADLKGGEQLAVRMTGVAGAPTEVQGQIGQALTAAGVPSPAVNFDEVAFIQNEGCSALDAYGRIRKPGGGSISVPQREFEKQRNLPGSPDPVASLAVVTLAPPQGQNFTLLGIEPSGEITQIFPGRGEIDGLAEQSRNLPEAERVVELAPSGEYRFRLFMDHTGWSGLILVSGDGPFDQALLAPAVAERGDEWRNRFLAAASEREWKSEMIWFKSVDKNPND
jgi:eukaryotic-like serine/threonine-protein kinase